MRHKDDNFAYSTLSTDQLLGKVTDSIIIIIIIVSIIIIFIIQ